MNPLQKLTDHTSTARHWCYKGKHFGDSKRFTKSQLARQSGMICRECVAKDKKDYLKRKIEQKQTDDVFNNMFFNFKGL